MTTRPMSLLSEIENGEPVPFGKMGYLRERARNRLYEFIVKKFMEKAESEGLTQVELARRTGHKPEVINRWLGSPGNWRLDTLTDLLVGIAAEEVEPASKALLGRAPKIYRRPEWAHDALASPTHLNQDRGIEDKLKIVNEAPAKSARQFDQVS